MGSTPEKDHGLSPLEFFNLCKDNANLIATAVTSISLVALASAQVSIALNQSKADLLKLTCAQWMGSNIGSKEKKVAYKKMMGLTMAEETLGSRENREIFLQSLCQ